MTPTGLRNTRARATSATASPDGAGAPLPANRLGPFLQHAKGEILEEWKYRVRSELYELGFGRNEPALSRFAPELLDRLIRAVIRSSSGEAANDEADVSSEIILGAGRFAPGCTVAEAVRELSLLRSVVMCVCTTRVVRLPDQIAHLVHSVIDEAIAEVASDLHRAACTPLEVSHRVERSLREDEDRMRLALNVAEVGTWDYRPMTGELTWDARIKELWGLPLDAEPTYEDFLAGIHPADRAWVDGVVERALSPESGGTYKIEYRAIGTGEERWVACEGKVFFDPEGRPLRFLGTVLDITERRREADFRERFVGILGHDLRQPLSVVTFASATLMKHASGDNIVELARLIARSGDRMSRMIRDLLDFARARQGGGIPISPEPLNLHDLLRHLVDEMAKVHEAHRIELSAPGNTEGIWDPDRMTQVFQNLLGNAVTYGAAESSISVEIVAMDSELAISVTNQGTPIPKNELGSLFSPYRRGKQARASERTPRGLGLGLYIAQEIVRAHGGSIEAASDAESGTRFTVIVPRCAVVPA